MTAGRIPLADGRRGGDRMRLFVARLWFEGNRFSRTITGAAAFERREFRTGAAALEGVEHTATELAAVAEFAGRHPQASLVVSRCASAEPGGPIDDRWFRRFVDETCADLAAAHATHAYLSLHGAAITTASDTPELEWLRALRAVAPGLPIAASFDLHGNLPPELIALLDFGTAYRCHPHTDMRETAARALARLETAETAAAPPGRLGLVGHLARLGSLVPSFNMRTAGGPMAELEALARRAEARPGVADVSVFGGFPYADTPHADGSVLVWADTASAARRVADELVEAFRSRLPSFAPVLPSAAAGLAEADRALAAGTNRVALTDPGDNPLSGGEATTTGLLRALLEARRHLPQIARLRPDELVFAYFADPALVDRARRAGIGARLEATFGAGAPEAFGGPVTIATRVDGLTGGRFSNTGAMERGRRVDCGDTAILETDGVRIIVTSAVCPANDPAFFVLHGVDLDRVRLICVKAKNHFRAAFAERCGLIVDVDCAGPAAADLRLLPFRNWRADGTARSDPSA